MLLLFEEMGVTDRCAVGACNNAREYKNKYVILSDISLPLMGVLSYDFENVMTQSFFPSGLLLETANILDAIRTLSYCC